MQKESIEWVCNNCGGTGKVKCPANKMEQSILIVCSHCSTPSAYGWCEKSGSGGEITGIVFSNFQRTWRCTDCGSTHKLAKDFYEDQVVFSPKRFEDVKKLKQDREIREQKHVPVWARNSVTAWESRRRYFMYVVVSVLSLFVITFAAFLSFEYLGVCNLSGARSICSNTFFVSIGFLGLLMFMFFLNPLIKIFFAIIANISLVIYRLRKFRE